MLKTFLTAPSVRILALGVALFALWSWKERRSTIEVSPALARALVTEREKEVGRPLNANEREAVLGHWVEEEVLFREALARKLDRSDPIVRRRLVQAMRFVLEEEEGAEPTQAELEQFVAQHPERFTIPASVSFEQVFLGQGDDGPARAALAAGAAFDTLGLPFPTGPRFVGQTEEALAGSFGSPFARHLFDLLDGWTVVESAFGRHLVRVTLRTEAKLPAVETIAGPVRSALREERRLRASAEQVAALRSGYDIGLPAP